MINARSDKLKILERFVNVGLINNCVKNMRHVLTCAYASSSTTKKKDNVKLLYRLSHAFLKHTNVLNLTKNTNSKTSSVKIKRGLMLARRHAQASMLTNVSPPQTTIISSHKHKTPTLALMLRREGWKQKRQCEILVGSISREDD